MKKFVIAGFLSAVMVAAASSAMAADQQATTAEMDNQLNWQAVRDFGAAHASARVPVRVRKGTAVDQEGIDFQAVGTE